jgi:hypothetical protein
MVLYYIFLSISHLYCFFNHINNSKNNINVNYVTWFTRHKDGCVVTSALAYILVHFYIDSEWVDIYCPKNLNCHASKLPPLCTFMVS